MFDNLDKSDRRTHKTNLKNVLRYHLIRSARSDVGVIRQLHRGVPVDQGLTRPTLQAPLFEKAPPARDASQAVGAKPASSALQEPAILLQR